MNHQATMLKAMTKEERLDWATQRTRSYFRSLKSEGFTLEEIGKATLAVGAGAVAAAKGKEPTAAFLTALAYRLIDGSESLPSLDEPETPFLLM